jgi:hypothetical protein
MGRMGDQSVGRRRGTDIVGVGGESNSRGDRSRIGPEVSFSENDESRVGDASDMMKYLLTGLALCVDDVCAGDIVYSTSEVDDGDAFKSRGVVGDVDEKTESLDVGASDRKLHSRFFLSQFAHDGCLASHCSCGQLVS